MVFLMIWIFHMILQLSLSELLEAKVCLHCIIWLDEGSDYLSRMLASMAFGRRGYCCMLKILRLWWTKWFALCALAGVLSWQIGISRRSQWIIQTAS